MTIIVTGGKGHFAGSLKKKLEAEYLGSDELDITDENSVSNAFEKYHPTAVVHLAALTKVDYCEDHQDEAYKINVTGTENIANACKKYGAYLIYISTDNVFDGVKGNYLETDATNPINVYGKTKYEGEKKVTEIITSNSLIMRPAYPFGTSEKNNLSNWIISSLRQGKKITPHSDQIVTPTYLEDITDNIVKALNEKPTGILHCSGKETITMYDFCVLFAKIKNLQTETIVPIKVSENLQLKAKRPLNTSLNVEKAMKLGYKFTDLRKAMEETNLQ